MTVTKPAPRAVLYSRLSRESAASTSIAGQRDDLSSLAEREGWEVVTTFVDEGKSGGKERAKAQAAYDLWASGDADILAVYAYDRWSRMGIKTLAALIEVVDARALTATPAVFMAVREGIESTQPDWQLRAAFAADMAKRERDLVAARQTAARERMRRQGRNAGHGVPPFGYRTGPHPSLPVGRGYHVIDDERSVVLEVAERIAADESLTKIGASLMRRGIPTATSPARRAALAADMRERGETPSARDAALLDLDPTTLDRGTWTPGGIRRTWSSDHLLGRVSHDGAPLLGDDGAPLAPFEPILTPDIVLAIRARFDASTRGPRKRRATALLSGVAFCSGCEGKMYPRATGRLGYLSYACSASGRGVPCKHPVSMTVRKLDTAVAERFLGFMREVPEVTLATRFDDAASAAELADTEARLKELAARLVTTDDPSEVAALMDSLATLKARRAALRQAAPTRTAELIPTGRTYGEAWAAARDDDERRALLLNAVDHVLVHPATSDERVTYLWHPGYYEAL